MPRAILTLLGVSCLAACTVPEADIPFDSDGDGLMDDDELSLGTNPDSADSDGDGFEDGDEAESGYDPTDPDNHPYFGGWSIDSACKDGITSTGTTEGDIAANFQLLDQFGDTVNAYDFCGRALLLVSGAFW